MYNKNEKYKSKCFELFNLAIKNVNEENYLDTYYYLKQAVEMGHTDSQYFLGIWYLFGLDCIDLKQDISKAIYYLVKSAYNFNYDSRKLLTALDINIKELKLTEQNIDLVIKSIIEEKGSKIKNIMETRGYKILEDIKNPYMVRPIIKDKQITLKKPTLLEQHNISIQHNREKHAKYKPKLIYTKEQMNANLLVELIKENLQLKRENTKLQMKKKKLKEKNELLEQEIKKTKKEWQDMCDMLITITTQQQIPQQTQEELLQNTQIILPQIEFMQPINQNQQLLTQNPIYTETMQPYQALQHNTQYYQTQLNQFANATNQFNVPTQAQNEYNYLIQYGQG